MITILGQLINTLSGGAMWQDVNNHGGSHEIVDLLIFKDKPFQVTSTHHQMMIPGPKGDVIAIAHRATSFLSADSSRKKPEFDTEVVYYEHTKSLCFQPHPENGYCIKGSPTNVYFFELLNYLL